VLMLRVGRTVLNLVLVYAPQVQRSMEEKKRKVLHLPGKYHCYIRAEVGVCSDLNGHVGVMLNGLDGIKTLKERWYLSLQMP